jgi:hypothetical protein
MKPDINQKLLIDMLRDNPHFTRLLAEFGNEIREQLDYGPEEGSDASCRPIV